MFCPYCIYSASVIYLLESGALFFWDLAFSEFYFYFYGKTFSWLFSIPFFILLFNLVRLFPEVKQTWWIWEFNYKIIFFKRISEFYFLTRSDKFYFITRTQGDRLDQSNIFKKVDHHRPLISRSTLKAIHILCAHVY